MKQSTLNRLDRSAVEIAGFIETCLRGFNGGRCMEPGRSFRDEVKRTVSHRNNRYAMAQMCEGDPENICKSKEQIDYLADAVIDRLKEAGVDIPAPFVG